MLNAVATKSFDLLTGRLGGVQSDQNDCASLIIGIFGFERHCEIPVMPVTPRLQDSELLIQNHLLIYDVT